MALTLEDKKLIFVGGKGGVGKTTSASAIAIHLSEKMTQGEKILLFSTDPAHSISDSFNIKIGDTPTQITDNLDAIEINVDQLMNEFKGQHKEAIQELLTKTASLDQQEADHALELAIPGIDEFMSLIKLSSFLEQNIYRTIVVDTAPTGHTIRLLELPVDWSKHIEEAAKGSGQTCLGPVQTIQDSKDRYNRATALLKNSKRTKFIFVMRPEELSLYETLRASKELESIGIKSYEGNFWIYSINCIVHESRYPPRCSYRCCYFCFYVLKL